MQLCPFGIVDICGVFLSHSEVSRGDVLYIPDELLHIELALQAFGSPIETGKVSILSGQICGCQIDWHLVRSKWKLQIKNLLDNAEDK